jgi:aldose 1-epimerase
MLANHVYWNLDAFTTGPGANILNNTLHLPYADRAIVIDNIEVPTGALEVVQGTGLDFTSPKKLGQDIFNTHQCGYNCTGIDNAFILDRPRYSGAEANDLVVLTMSSPATGIQMDIRTNQQSLQVYSCVGQNGTIPVKASQQHGARQKTYVEKYGCVSFFFLAYSF